jgi:hypothetical protein
MNWTTEHSEVSSADRESVWALWSDVGSWPAWDDGIEQVTLDGPFEAGSRGSLKPAGSRAVKFAVIEARPGEGFVDETRLPLARMRFEHELTDAAGGGVRITHRVTISGPLTPLWRRVIGRDLERDLPGTVATLARHAA